MPDTIEVFQPSAVANGPYDWSCESEPPLVHLLCRLVPVHSYVSSILQDCRTCRTVQLHVCSLQAWSAGVSRWLWYPVYTQAKLSSVRAVTIPIEEEQ